jgi:AP-2 complex subunit beta-1
MFRYSTEVDIDFVKKAVRSIGRLAIKVESISDGCIDALVELIDLRINYIIQEAVIVIKDIFRRYPGKYERVIPNLCEDLDVFTEPDSKSAIIWIIGQYADRIDNAPELFEDLTYLFLEEPSEVQMMQILVRIILMTLRFNYRYSQDQSNYFFISPIRNLRKTWCIKY